MVAVDDVGGPSVHRHELLAALSRGIDLCMGQPMGHILGQTFIALRLAERAGLDEAARREVFHTSMLAWSGCHVDSLEQARWFGDDHAAKAGIRAVDLRDERAAAAYLRRHLAAGQPAALRRRTIAGFRAEGVRQTDEMFPNHRQAATALAEALGVPLPHRSGLGQVFERWDGRGEPGGLRGAEIEFSARASDLGDVVTAIWRAGGQDAAVAVARARRGTEFDPDLVDAFCDDAAALFDELASTGPLPAALRACPALDDGFDSAQFDAALAAIADYVDLKSPSALGHQAVTAELTDAAAAESGFDASERQRARRAALVHDMGRLGVPAAVWESPYPLTPAQAEQIRLHPYVTESILEPFAGLRALGAIAGQHHERLDGSGYPRALSGDAISPAARLLAAADAYSSRAERRPHRAAVPATELPAVMREEVREGRLDATAVEAVLVAAGHRRRRRRSWPAGLTDREVEVLRLAARGRSTAEMADELKVAPKTVAHHLEHIYVKTGARNRAMLAVFTMRHALFSTDAVAVGGGAEYGSIAP